MNWIIDLKNTSMEDLTIELFILYSKINGPENKGRITANDSYELDYWFDLVEDIEEELERRK